MSEYSNNERMIERIRMITARQTVHARGLNSAATFLSRANIHSSKFRPSARCSWETTRATIQQVHTRTRTTRLCVATEESLAKHGEHRPAARSAVGQYKDEAGSVLFAQ